MPVDPLAVAQEATPSRERVLAALRAVQPDTPAQVTLKLGDRLRGTASWGSAWYFCRQTRKLPAHVVRALVTGWKAERSSESLIFLSLVDPTASDAAVQASWARAVQLLLDLNSSYGLGSAKWLAKIDGVRADPALLAAVQTAVVGAESPRGDCLAALLRDASPDSLDALTPYVSKARQAKDHRLDELGRLRRYARDTKELRALFDGVDADTRARAKTSAAAVVGQVLPFLDGPFSLRVSFGSEDLSFGNVPRLQGSVVLDSRKSRTFAVSLSERTSMFGWKTTSFDAQRLLRDDLGLGRCEPLEVPSWLARAAKKLRGSWGEPSVYSTLRGKKRDAAVAWLFSGAPQTS